MVYRLAETLFMYVGNIKTGKHGNKPTAQQSFVNFVCIFLRLLTPTHAILLVQPALCTYQNLIKTSSNVLAKMA